MQEKKRRGQPRELCDFGVWVKHRLIDRQMTAVELCRRVGISRKSYMNKILHGEVSDSKYINRIINELQDQPSQ